jgi:hypothetical protein
VKTDQNIKKGDKMSVVIETVDGITSGTVDHEVSIGDTVTVQAQDENGMPVESTGEVICNFERWEE